MGGMFDPPMDNAPVGDAVLVCPWCFKQFEERKEVLVFKRITECPHCLGLCEAWADGDIDYDHWYLTKVRPE